MNSCISLNTSSISPSPSLIVSCNGLLISRLNKPTNDLPSTQLYPCDQNSPKCPNRPPSPDESSNAKEAYLNLELAESYAQVVLQSKLLGGAVFLNEKEVEEIYSLKK